MLSFEYKKQKRLARPGKRRKKGNVQGLLNGRKTIKLAMMSFAHYYSCYLLYAASAHLIVGPVELPRF
jgi:hypothetical protein